MADKPENTDRGVRITAQNAPQHKRLAMGLNPKVQTSVSRPATKP